MNKLVLVVALLSAGCADSSRKEIAALRAEVAQLREQLAESRAAQRKLDAKLARLVTTLGGVANSLISRISPSPAAAAKRSPALESLRKLGPLRYRISRAALDKIIASGALARGARLVPHRLGRRASGFRLFGIRSDTIYSALGLKNGDACRRINQSPLSTLESIKTAYAKAKKQGRVVLAIERQGKPLSLTVELAP